MIAPWGNENMLERSHLEALFRAYFMRLEVANWCLRKRTLENTAQSQLAELLGRSAGGLRYSLKYPSDPSTRTLKACGRKVGRRVYYPASEVARIILGSGEA
jgi:hypothetical protein